MVAPKMKKKENIMMNDSFSNIRLSCCFFSLIEKCFIMSFNNYRTFNVLVLSETS